MIISVDEFKEMGFVSDDDELSERCIKRAEYVLNGLSAGRAALVAQTGGAAADYVKQACAFQADAIIREENAVKKQDDAAVAKSDTERVSIGDFSYSVSASASKDNGNDFVEPLDTNFTVIRLLRAAGCLYTGLEVRK